MGYGEFLMVLFSKKSVVSAWSTTEECMLPSIKIARMHESGLYIFYIY